MHQAPPKCRESFSCARGWHWRAFCAFCQENEASTSAPDWALCINDVASQRVQHACLLSDMSHGGGLATRNDEPIARFEILDCADLKAFHVAAPQRSAMLFKRALQGKHADERGHVNAAGLKSSHGAQSMVERTVQSSLLTKMLKNAPCTLSRDSVSTSLFEVRAAGLSYYSLCHLRYMHVYATRLNVFWAGI